MKANSVLETIGLTPHIRIQRLFGNSHQVWIKRDDATGEFGKFTFLNLIDADWQPVFVDFFKGEAQRLATELLAAHTEHAVRTIAADLRGRIADAVHRLRRDRGVVPGIAVVLVGDNPASQVYVRNKRRMTESTAMRSFASLVTPAMCGLKITFSRPNS